MNKRILLLTLFCCLSLADLYAQYAMGMVYDVESLKKIPKKARLLTRDYSSLPKSHSLKKYCPTPQNQGDYSTCVGWSSAYAARTMLEAIRNGWTNQAYINREAFSPLYVYALIKGPNVTNCNAGTNMERAAETLKTKGVVKRSTLSDYCVGSISSSMDAEAAKYKLDDYFLLFGDFTTYNNAVNPVKKAIAENYPVVIGAKCFKSYTNVKDCWNGPSGKNDEQRGYHAMCVVGYDDNKFGGAFEIMNSWGTTWGDGGFFWMPYDVFAKNVYCGLEFYVKPKTKTTTTTTKTTKTTTKTTTTLNYFAGDISMKLSTGKTLKATLGTSNGFKRYRITQGLPSGTRYRIYVGSNQPGYVYVFSADQRNNVAVNFPTGGTSAALTYKANTIALPAENMWLELDDTRGTDYLCILFSKYTVDTNSLLRHLQSGKGSNFYEKIQNGFSKYLVPQSDIKFSSSSMNFTAKSTKQIIPLIVEFTHQ